ncbi:MAG: hypothetical protein UV67_C0013G0025 [Parcubacteria group bacterium GW2011_GWC1_43_12]|nr:MAG: hypothetical protein UV34_C0023G0009 [Parcubacteria group bacterium GW2011_GWB1_42_6]KKS91999.1 MAG: hypothetical protein UV67_C0013G0025 [Parcubacteria group bacterium GW2011_GWC1_43_12]
MKKAIILFWGSLLFAIFLTGPFLALAKIGVGVGIGKIQVDQPLKSGLIYTLPNFVLVNTGNEPSEYGIQIAYHQDQPELRPAKEWFKFEPSQFYLEPDQSQLVQIKLTLPIRGAKPGDYFAFLQGRPLQKTENGMTSVGIAAATKLYFTVAPANIFVGIYYRLGSLYKLYSPWSYVISAIIITALLVVILRRFFSFSIGIGLRKKENKNE